MYSHLDVTGDELYPVKEIAARATTATRLKYNLSYNPPRYDQVTSFSNLMSTRVKKPVGGTGFKEFGYEKCFLRSFIDNGKPQKGTSRQMTSTSIQKSAKDLLTTCDSIEPKSSTTSRQEFIAPPPMIPKCPFIPGLVTAFGFHKTYQDMLPYLHLEKEMLRTRELREELSNGKKASANRNELEVEDTAEDGVMYESYQEFYDRMHTRPDGSRIRPTLLNRPIVKKHPPIPIVIQSQRRQFEMRRIAKRNDFLARKSKTAQREAHRELVAKLEPVFPTVSKSIKERMSVKFAEQKDRKEQLNHKGLMLDYNKNKTAMAKYSK